MAQTAWDLIGFDGQVDGKPANVRIVGGRTLYEAVQYADARGGKSVKLSRLVVAAGMVLRQTDRYVDPDTMLDVVLDD